MSSIEHTKAILEEIFETIFGYLQLEATVNFSDEAAVLRVDIQSADSALLIGMHGANLIALEYLVRQLLYRRMTQDEITPEIYIDVAGYKEHQLEELREVAHTAAGRVREKQIAEALRPMNSFERRVVHVTLVDEPGILTESVGSDPHRRIIIKPSQSS